MVVRGSILFLYITVLQGTPIMVFLFHDQLLLTLVFDNITCTTTFHLRDCLKKKTVKRKLRNKDIYNIWCEMRPQLQNVPLSLLPLLRVSVRARSSLRINIMGRSYHLPIGSGVRETPSYKAGVSDPESPASCWRAR